VANQLLILTAPLMKA